MDNLQLHGKRVFILNVNSLEDFSVIPVEDFDKLENLQIELNSPDTLDMVKKQQQSKHVFDVGDKVLAEFVDGQLYRGETLAIYPSTAKIRFYDFGNIEENVKMSKMHHLPLHLDDPPGLSTRCRLTCGETGPKSVQAFIQLLSIANSFILEVFEEESGGDFLEVDIVKASEDGNDLVSIRDTLVLQGDATFQPDVETEPQSFPLANIFQETYRSQKLQFKVGDIHKGFISHVPFVQPGSRVEVCVMVSSAVPVYSLPRLMKKLARTYRLPNSEKLWGIDGYHVFPGMMCAVRDFNGVWNRGEILSNIRGRMYSVRCVDFGENLSVSVYQLRRLFPEYMRYPVMCKTVSLPVKFVTMDQAIQINQELRDLLYGLQVGFEVLEEDGNGPTKVSMDYEGAEIANIIRNLKRRIK